MEFRIQVQELARTLALFQSIVQKKNTMPILANVLLEASTEGNSEFLTLSATDLEISLKTRIPCKVAKPGLSTVSAKTLSDIVKLLPGPDVTLSLLPNQQLAIKSAHTSAHLLALPAQDYPAFIQYSDLVFHTASKQRFLKMIEKTLYCSSTDENRYNLTGVFFEPSRDKTSHLYFVATDGHRLSKIDQEFDGLNLSQVKSAILPRKGLMELARLLENQQISSDEFFSFGFNQNHMVSKWANTILAIRLIDGQFPDYHQVIPKLTDKIVRASKNDVLQALKRVSVMASDKNQCVKFAFRSSTIQLCCNNPELGEVTDDVSVEFNGPEMNIGFNAKYILEAVNSLDDSNMMLKFTDPLSPMLITGMNNETHVCVVMPMRM